MTMNLRPIPFHSNSVSVVNSNSLILDGSFMQGNIRYSVRVTLENPKGTPVLIQPNQVPPQLLERISRAAFETFRAGAQSSPAPSLHQAVITRSATEGEFKMDPSETGKVAQDRLNAIQLSSLGKGPKRANDEWEEIRVALMDALIVPVQMSNAQIHNDLEGFYEALNQHEIGGRETYDRGTQPFAYHWIDLTRDGSANSSSAQRIERKKLDDKIEKDLIAAFRNISNPNNPWPQYLADLSIPEQNEKTLIQWLINCCIAGIQYYQALPADPARSARTKEEWIQFVSRELIDVLDNRFATQEMKEVLLGNLAVQLNLNPNLQNMN